MLWFNNYDWNHTELFWTVSEKLVVHKNVGKCTKTKGGVWNTQSAGWQLWHSQQAMYGYCDVWLKISYPVLLSFEILCFLSPSTEDRFLPVLQWFTCWGASRCSPVTDFMPVFDNAWSIYHFLYLLIYYSHEENQGVDYVVYVNKALHLKHKSLFYYFVLSITVVYSAGQWILFSKTVLLSTLYSVQQSFYR